MAGSKKAVIIGAGIGGITTAGFLAGNGFQVDVYEKNSSPGGRCSRIIRDGHRFDLGATMLLMPGIYRSVFKSLGLEFEQAFPVKELDDLYRIYFDDGEVLSFTSDKARMREQLERIEPGSSLKAEKYISAGYRIFKVSLKNLIDRNFYNIFSFLSPAMLPVLYKIKPLTSNFRYAERFFKHPHLLMAFTFQNIYVGQSPFTSPALFSMVPAAELTEGSMFPVPGGLYSVVDRLTENAKQKGAGFHFEKSVSKIIIEGKKAKGVLLEDGSEISADIIIANADLPYVYRELLPDRKMSAHLDRLKYSCSALCFHWGIDKRYTRLSHHNVFLSDNFKKGLDKIFIEKSVSDTPSFYVHAPVATDPSAAPEGRDTLSVIVAAGHTDRNIKQDWEHLKEKTRDAVIRRLEKAGLEKLAEHITFEICYTPESWERACNISKGSVFGSLAHNIFQMGYFRPHNRHDKYKNIYFAGGSTHPGNGIPNVLLSARLVSGRIMRENKM